MALPVVIFPDVELWATAWLRAALAARPEPYASGVTVATKVPSTMPARLVTIRRDGGSRLDVVRENPRIGVNVWAASEGDATDMANLVRALLWSAPDGNPVCKVTETSGPTPIAEADGKPHRYMTFELIVRGAQA